MKGSKTEKGAEKHLQNLQIEFQQRIQVPIMQLCCYLTLNRIFALT